MQHQLGKNTKVTRVMNAVAAGTSDQDGTVLDMQGYDGVMFVAMLGDVVNTCVLSLEARESTASDGSGSTQVSNSKTTDFTADATSGDNKCMLVDCYRPQKRYVFPRLHRGTANAPIDGILAIQYKCVKRPPTHDAGVISAAYSAQ